MHIGEKIKGLAERNKTNISEFAHYIGKTRQSIYNLFNKSQVATTLLEKVAEYFNVPISYFFDEDIDESIKRPIKPDYKKLYEDACKEIEMLKENLSDKEKLILSYEERLKDISKYQELYEKVSHLLKK